MFVKNSVKILYLWAGGKGGGGEKKGGDSRAHSSESSWDVKLYFSSFA
jgi:hypothetical protein